MNAQPIVFAPHSWSRSHVGRSIQVAKELQRRGFRCVFVGDGPSVLAEDSLVRQAGLEAHPLIDLSEAPVTAHGFDFHTARSLRRLVPAERELIQHLQPAVIVSDFRPSIHVAAAIENVGVIALLPTRWTHHGTARRMPPREHPLSLRVTRLLGQALGMALLKPLAAGLWDGIFGDNVRVYNELLAEHGLPPHDDILSLLEGSVGTFLTDAPEWCRVKPHLPPPVRVAGPLYWTAPASSGWAEELPHDKPWIYLSAGSAASSDLLPALFQELGDLPFRVLMSTAGHELPRRLPANFIVKDVLPGDEVMARSALTIATAGSSAVYQAIREHKPMILIAMRDEQEWHAIDAVRHGYVRAYHRRQVIVRRGLLRQAVIETLEQRDVYTQRLSTLAYQIRKYDAVKTIADGVELAVASRLAAAR